VIRTPARAVSGTVPPFLPSARNPSCLGFSDDERLPIVHSSG
jgi:hypothetical protein